VKGGTLPADGERGGLTQRARENRPVPAGIENWRMLAFDIPLSKERVLWRTCEPAGSPVADRGSTETRSSRCAPPLRFDEQFESVRARRS